MKFLLSLGFLFFATHSYAVLVTTPVPKPAPEIGNALCGKDQVSGFEYGWCVKQDPLSKNKDLLYVMHGGGGDEKNGVTEGYLESYAETWKSLGFGTPTIITFSFGPQWLLNDMATPEHPALLTAVLNEIIPALEAKVGGLKGRRLLLGHSMGGYNGAELALRAPALFDRVALLCPGLAVTNPFGSVDEITNFILSQPETTDARLVLGVSAWIRDEFLTAENWARHDPLALALSLVQAKDPLKTQFFVSCSKDDEYGFYNGAKAFAEALAPKTKSEFVSIESGGHCAQDMNSRQATATFLAR